MEQIGIFILPSNYTHSLIIKGGIQNGIHFFCASVLEKDNKIASIEIASWQELKEFLKENDFYRYQAQKINSKYFDLLKSLRKELYRGKSKKINSQERILLLWKRLNYEKSLDLNELAVEFNVSYSQLIRDITILRRVFENVEIRYNRLDKKYEIK